MRAMRPLFITLYFFIALFWSTLNDRSCYGAYGLLLWMFMAIIFVYFKTLRAFLQYCSNKAAYYIHSVIVQRD